MAKERAGLFALLGLAGVTLGGIALASASRGPSSVTVGPGRIIKRPDWTGCGVPPEWCVPPPRFKCRDSVYVDLDGFTKGRAYQIVSRTWGQSPDSNSGLWVYGMIDPAAPPEDTSKTLGMPSEEANLSLASSAVPATVKKVAAALAPTAVPAVVKSKIAPITAQQEAAMNLPLYPQGLVVSKGSVKGSVISISKRDDTYYYKVEAGIGFITQDYNGSESYVMNMLAEKTGQKPYGFAFPAGVTLQMKNLKVAIKDRKLNDGRMFYVTDTLGEISEPELIIKLYQAQKG
jgi:hypothetical protein